MAREKRILLINPWIYDFAAVNMWARPLGLLKVAEYLSSYDVEIKFIDCLNTFRRKRYNMGKYPKETLPTPEPVKEIKRRYGRYGISKDEFIERLKEAYPVDAILVTSIMTYWYPAVIDIINICREHYPDTPIILGGIYATLCKEHAERTTKADKIIPGPADGRLIKALNDFGVSLKQTNKKVPYYKLGLYTDISYAPVLTSIGCPFRCSYCASGLLRTDFIQRPTNEILSEIQQLHSLGVQDMAFYDDALLYRSDYHIKPLLRGIAEMNLPVRFHTPNGLHARYIDWEIARLMYLGNFKTIRLSLETVNPERQKATGGKVGNEELREAVSLLKKAGFSAEHIGVYLMYGLPDQNIEEVWEGVRFLKDLKVRINLAEYSPIPGTKDWERLVKDGVIDEEIDPLLTNNSVFSVLYSGYRHEDIKRLKDDVVRYNQSITSS